MAVEGYSFEYRQPDGDWTLPLGAKKFATRSGAEKAMSRCLAVMADEGFVTTGRVVSLVRSGRALVVEA